VLFEIFTYLTVSKEALRVAVDVLPLMCLCIAIGIMVVHCGTVLWGVVVGIGLVICWPAIVVALDFPADGAPCFSQRQSPHLFTF
jgi:hypothetical protein